MKNLHIFLYVLFFLLELDLDLSIKCQECDPILVMLLDHFKTKPRFLNHL